MAAVLCLSFTFSFDDNNQPKIWSPSADPRGINPVLHEHTEHSFTVGTNYGREEGNSASWWKLRRP